MTEDEIRAHAIVFAKQNKDRIAREVTNTTTYPPEDTPVSVFMAGSPGAGKTEISKMFIELLAEKPLLNRAIRIDGDEIRQHLPGYTGSNSHLFQGAISIIVERLHDYTLKQKQSFVLDGTFSDYEKAVTNIRRSLAKKRIIMVIYVYQDPEIAWGFTRAREIVEGRHIPKNAFIRGFFGARQTVCRVREEFGNEVSMLLIRRNYQEDTATTYGIVSKSQIDEYVPEQYTQEYLGKIL